MQSPFYRYCSVFVFSILYTYDPVLWATDSEKNLISVFLLLDPDTAFVAEAFLGLLIENSILLYNDYIAKYL